MNFIARSCTSTAVNMARSQLISSQFDRLNLPQKFVYHLQAGDSSINTSEIFGKCLLKMFEIHGEKREDNDKEPI